MPSDNRLFVWLPRVLGIVTTLFLATFALDAFDEPGGVVAIALALLVHLVPAAMVGVLVVVAWRRELAGAVGFALLAGVYLAVSAGRFPWTVYAAIAGPLFLTAALLVASWRAPRSATRSLRVRG